MSVWSVRQIKFDREHGSKNRLAVTDTFLQLTIRQHQRTAVWVFPLFPNDIGHTEGSLQSP